MAQNFTLVDSLGESKGKFADEIGNVALIDCHYINNMFFKSYNRYFKLLIQKEPFYYVLLQDIDQILKNRIGSIDMCNYALTIGGALEDQVSTYGGGREQRLKKLREAGGLIVDALGMTSNTTITMPLEAKMAKNEFLVDFNRSMCTILTSIFVILGVSMIYTVFSQNLERKTGDLRVLRLLGFSLNTVA